MDKFTVLIDNENVQVVIFFYYYYYALNSGAWHQTF